MTIQQTPPTTTPITTTAITPAAPVVPASQMSVRCLWGAVGALAAGCVLYVLHEHPALTDPVVAVGGLGAVAVAVGVAVARR
ncbi:hypothetical protein OHA98_41460 [Streptomyces sp. NBC_00654]|uniref:hypothetical protein n=1 Tax=Streptomyces sp. NBC_00654 TaxID=2975799 RepID=UPI00224CF996|nr:hypothetical protein [Streptomyces sp. NBC_00654]MCX4971082.1 hypothetical protein [Streptomyces sp. NBC_00654]